MSPSHSAGTGPGREGAELSWSLPVLPLARGSGEVIALGFLSRVQIQKTALSKHFWAGFGVLSLTVSLVFPKAVAPLVLSFSLVPFLAGSATQISHFWL